MASSVTATGSIVLKSSLVFAIAIVAFGAAVRPAQADSCPHASVFTSKDAKTYVARFYSGATFTGTVDATFYTANASYSATISQLEITKATKAGFLSRSFALLNPSPDPVEGVALIYHGSDASQTCAERAAVPRPSEYASLARYTGAPAPGPGETPIPLVYVASEAPLPCAKPYASAGVVKAIEPDYPETAAYVHAQGTSLVLVNLLDDGSVDHTSIFNSSGNISLDAAAVASASHSTYSQAVFRCMPIAGAYIFRADFIYDRR